MAASADAAILRDALATLGLLRMRFEIFRSSRLTLKVI
jgi:hypothetical protein